MIVPLFFILNFLAGAMYSLGFPNWINGGIWLFPTISATILFYSFVRFPKAKSQILNLLIFSLSFNLVGYYWIPYTLTEFGALPYWLSLILSLFFTLIIIPQYWIFLGLKGLWFKSPWSEKKLPSITLKILFLAFLLTTLEYFTPQQFPGHLGHNWLVLAPYLGPAPFAGVPLYSLISYILVFWIIEKVRGNKPSRIIPIFFLVFVIINFAFPLKKERIDDLPLSIRVVQPNVGNFLKLDSEKGDFNSIQKVLNSLIDLSTRPNEHKMDLIVWPETAYPYSLHSPYLLKNADHTPSIFQEITISTQAELLTGGYDLKNPNTNDNDYYETEFNSAFLFGKNHLLKDTYHKKKLIPFGETLPLGPLKGLARHVINNITYFAQGDHFTKFKLDNGLIFITPICYELLFPQFISEYLASGKKANFMINLTNDSWYGKTSELEQHLFLAKWRALEFGRPIVRSTNTGITSVIFTDGSESNRLKIYEENILDLVIKVPKDPSTLYEKFGFEITALIFIILMLLSYFLEKPSLNRS